MAKTAWKWRLRSAACCAGILVSLRPALAHAGELHALVRDKAGKPVADAVVIAVPAGRPAIGVAGANETVVVDQVNKEFVPYVLPVHVGTAVNFPNNDNVRHHVYSFSPAKRFELPLYLGTPAAPVVFDKPGVVILGCNIHDWMIGYVYVSDSPHFAKTGGDGKAQLADLPDGEYVVRVWHPRLEGAEDATRRGQAVPRAGSVEVAWEIGLLPDFRIRRAPLPGQSGYR